MKARILLAAGIMALAGCSMKTPSAENPAPVDAKPSLPETPHASPWEEARTRGIVFRGIGNEPGWLVEVGTGETPALHAELDYGERKLEVARMQALSGILGYAGKTADGVDVKLHLQREDCSDGMSDNNYPVSAKLIVGDKTYTGCGRFLQE